MKRFLCLMLVAALLPVCALAASDVTWLEGELFYPDAQSATYRFIYRYPFVEGDTQFAAGVNDYYQVALSEMTDLVLPMYANETDMTGEDVQQVSQICKVTCDTDDYFGVLMRQTQTVDGREQTTLRSQVFAASGEYEGETLTLRGLVMVGESSVQLAALVLADIEKALLAMEGLREGWSPEALALDFFPEQDFYADENANAVFYIQPGLLCEDALYFTYTRDMLSALLPSDTE